MLSLSTSFRESSPAFATRIAVLLVAAGVSGRFGSSVPKQYLPLAGMPVLWHSLRLFTNHPRITAVLPIIHTDHLSLYNSLAPMIALPSCTLLSPIVGGETRQDSVYAGLLALSNYGAFDYVLIHDAARPLLPLHCLDALIHGLSPDHGVMLALPVHDTIKRVDNDQIVETQPREHHWHAQTPQGFPFSVLLDAYVRFRTTPCTDDASLATLAGFPTHVCLGSLYNMKITTSDDLSFLEQFFISNKAKSVTTITTMGLDIHAFDMSAVGEHTVMLAGVPVPHEYPVLAHSDGDVILHALCDAILGSFGGGDIGALFPPTDSRFSGMASTYFLSEVLERFHSHNGLLVHVDITIVAETPKISKYRELMLQSLSSLLSLPLHRLGLKATTAEKLGSLGRGEGIMAQVILTSSFTTHNT